MMEYPETTRQKPGRIFIGFAVVCMIAAVAVVLFGGFGDSAETGSEILETIAISFDHNSASVYADSRIMWPEYREAGSEQRTLEAYYALRQYAGAPPLISHEIDASADDGAACLSCHAEGGWAEQLSRSTPRTPHPRMTNCRQCHVQAAEGPVFRANEWLSAFPPRLGTSSLPGAPPLIAHGLQMRENCIACHVGPGAVSVIRVTHSSRGNCRQCHVPRETDVPYRRIS